MGNSQPLSLYFCLFNTAERKQMFRKKSLAMTGFKLRTSGVGSIHSTN